MYCTKCGTKLREGAKFCHVCGHPVVGVKQASRQAETGNNAADDVNGTVKAPAGKTAVKSEIKEKAVDLAKAGARQILAALKDRDINASATPGEVSCKPDAAQSAFMKMLKKGMMAIVILFSCATGISAQDWEMKQPIGGVLDYTATYGTASVKVKVTGGSISQEPYKVYSGPHDLSAIQNKESVGYKRAQKRGHISVSFAGEVKVGDKITVHVDILSPQTYGNGGYYNAYFTTSNGVRDFAKRWKSPLDIEYDVTSDDIQSGGIELTVKLKTEDYYGDEVLLTVNFHKADKKAGSDGTLSSAPASDPNNGDKYLDTEGIDGIVDIDTEADEESGENGWVVPAAIAGALGAGGLALKGRKKKRPRRRSRKKHRRMKRKSPTMTSRTRTTKRKLRTRCAYARISATR